MGLTGGSPRSAGPSSSSGLANSTRWSVTLLPWTSKLDLLALAPCSFDRGRGTAPNFERNGQPAWGDFLNHWAGRRREGGCRAAAPSGRCQRSPVRQGQPQLRIPGGRTGAGRGNACGDAAAPRVGREVWRGPGRGRQLQGKRRGRRHRDPVATCTVTLSPNHIVLGQLDGVIACSSTGEASRA